MQAAAYWMQHERFMQTSPSPRRYRIVIALDDSEYSEIVLEHALDQASRHDAPDLHVLFVVDDRTDVAATKAWLATVVLEGLDAFRAGRSDWRTRLHVRHGDPAEEIANLAAEIDTDLLVIGRYGVHHPRRSVADAVLATAPYPTLVVGLTGHVVEAEPPCTACVAVREESDGERWFCVDHSAPDRLRLSTLIPRSTTLTHGGPLW
jgi:nucleotide-binding universal stress UspA family protein